MRSLHCLLYALNTYKMAWYFHAFVVRLVFQFTIEAHSQSNGVCLLPPPPPQPQCNANFAWILSEAYGSFYLQSHGCCIVQLYICLVPLLLLLSLMSWFFFCCWLVAAAWLYCNESVFFRLHFPKVLCCRSTLSIPFDIWPMHRSFNWNHRLQFSPSLVNCYCSFIICVVSSYQPYFIT